MDELPLLAPIRSRVTARDVLRRVEARRRVRRFGAAAVVCVVVLALVPRAGIRTRGIGSEPEPPLIHAALDRADPVPLRDGAELDRGDGVVVQVIAPGPGTLQLLDGTGAPIWPPGGPERVQAGPWVMGGDHPVAWSPDRSGPAALVARWCREDGGCAESTLRLTVR